jgi:hypothetical protein
MLRDRMWGERMTRTSCDGCGLSVYDLPDEIGDPEMVRDQFFDFDDAGDLYCNGCAVTQGVWL